MCEICCNGIKDSPLLQSIRKIIPDYNYPDKKEIIVKSAGEELNYCIDCYNAELEGMQNFCCEECEQLESRENLVKGDNDEYLCPACYYHIQAEQTAWEQHYKDHNEYSRN